jgi:hypothetical protein
MEGRDKNSTERKVYWPVAKWSWLVRRVPVTKQNYIFVA